MGWVLEETTEHEGWPASVLTDGRPATDSTAGYVLAGDERVPGDRVAGFQVRCACGWSGAYWTRVDPGQQDSSARRIHTPDGFDPPAEVEDSMHAEWLRHVAPAQAATAIAAAAGDHAATRTALDAAVRAGRAAGVSWADVGAAAGMSRQSAHERWAHTGR